MNEMFNDLIILIKKHCSVQNVDYPKNGQAAMDLDPGEIHTALALVKAQGYRQLSMLSCVDWIKDGQLQLVYLLFNWDSGLRLQIRTRIGRDNPKFMTVTNIYPGAKYYERDVHEFFGVEFAGNPESYNHLFLENWDDMPPMRKDFDPQAYSDRKFPARQYKIDYNTKEGEGK